MEEWSQTQHGDNEFPRNQTTNHDDNNHRDPVGAISLSNTQLPHFTSGTYIVQVPKDQIYRVPRPENALIIENHRNRINQQGGSSRSSCCSRRYICVVVTLVVVGIIIGLVIGLTKLLTKHDDPQFNVKQVIVKKLQKNQHDKRPHYEYDITIEAKNPNQMSRISYSYKGNGDISLYFKKKKIARGDFPNLDQYPKSSTDFDVILGNEEIDKLPEEVERSMNSTNSKNQRLSLSLSMDVPIEFKVWGISSKCKNIRVSCSLIVNSLTKNSQEVIDSSYENSRSEI
ncbi:NDR1/HIN1-like protein 13 [Solanum dulcamara]|uniref:NDR1/HIN1-like protein 13 n=1 Tax=Solanum dulcamara TaxID=45834 RepID=UPI002485C86D|nr:NDR1/HIN1-like protein 13 [Solanum dulcamara]